MLSGVTADDSFEKGLDKSRRRRYLAELCFRVVGVGRRDSFALRLLVAGATLVVAECLLFELLQLPLKRSRTWLEEEDMQDWAHLPG